MSDYPNERRAQEDRQSKLRPERGAVTVVVKSKSQGSSK